MLNALKVAVILTAVDNMSKQVASAVGRSSMYLTRFAKETSKIGDRAFSVGQQAGMFGLAVGAPLLMTVRAAEQAQAEVAKLEQGFKTMGDTSGKMAKKAQEFSSALMMDIAIDDENIMAVQGKLATFEKVIMNSAGTAEIFERSTRAAFDMEAAGFGDSMSNATQLGKALGDPLKGMQALKKSGTLMQADVERIGKEYKRTGDLLKAQRQIMEAIEKQVQGKAAANAKATDKLKIAFGEIAEQIGGALLPEVQKFAKYLQDVLPDIQKWIEKNKGLVTGVVKFAAGLAATSLAISGVAFVFGGLMKALSFGATVFGTITTAVGLFSGGLAMVTVNFKALDMAMKANVIILIATLIAAAAVAIYYNWDKIKKFFISLWNGPLNNKYIQAALAYFFPFIGLPILIIKNWSKIKAFFISLWEGVKAVFSAVWRAIRAILWDYQPAVLIYKNWGKIVSFFSDVWDKVKNVFNSFLVYLATLGNRFYNAGVNIVNNIWNGMKAKFKDMVAWFKDGLQDMRNMLPFSPAKTGPLKDIHKLKLVETIAASIKPSPMVNAMNRSLTSVRGAMSPKGFGSSGSKQPISSGGGGGGVSVNFSPTINVKGGSPADKQDFINMLKEYQPELLKAIESAMARKQRAKFA